MDMFKKSKLTAKISCYSLCLYTGIAVLMRSLAVILDYIYHIKLAVYYLIQSTLAVLIQISCSSLFNTKHRDN